MMNHIKSTSLAVFTLLLLAGCTKVTQENFEKIEVAMAYSEVTAVLGEPDNCESLSLFKNCFWGDNKKQISIKFVDDKVTLKSSKGLTP
ncbi:hypothetical protein [Zooshikella harenae]|uniref:DUF3862 domain-containing protein n=1 Tax=Zooshikella harenae TaxID=2827238 RepID=A0ABS5ZI79_9GAMM|nr:hypothetical protein [Zooshikella harenae]MBU2713784.1 hypothetical protein [Zooshikella harenae]